MNKGFTLIEILVTSVVMVVVGVGIVGLQYILGDAQNRAFSSFTSVSDSNYTITSLVRELRTAQPGDNGAYPLSLAEDNEIIFYSDYDFDDDVERLHYYLNGGQLIRGIIEPVGFPATYPTANETTKVVSSNIQNTDPVFLYFNSDWPQDLANNPLPTPADLAETRFIRIYLDINSSNDPGQNYELDSFVTVRMLKDNL